MQTKATTQKNENSISGLRVVSNAFTCMESLTAAHLDLDNHLMRLSLCRTQPVRSGIQLMAGSGLPNGAPPPWILEACTWFCHEFVMLKLLVD